MNEIKLNFFLFILNFKFRTNTYPKLPDRYRLRNSDGHEIKLNQLEHEQSISPTSNQMAYKRLNQYGINSSPPTSSSTSISASASASPANVGQQLSRNSIYDTPTSSNPRQTKQQDSSGNTTKTTQASISTNIN